MLIAVMTGRLHEDFSYSTVLQPSGKSVNYHYVGVDKSLAFHICSTTKGIFLGWVQEVRTTKP
jgi:hypothetical protein